jgi:hypothetical protein
MVNSEFLNDFNPIVTLPAFYLNWLFYFRPGAAARSGLSRFSTGIGGLGVACGEWAEPAWSGEDAPFGRGRGDRAWPDDSAVPSAAGGI